MKITIGNKQFIPEKFGYDHEITKALMVVVGQNNIKRNINKFKLKVPVAELINGQVQVRVQYSKMNNNVIVTFNVSQDLNDPAYIQYLVLPELKPIDVINSNSKWLSETMLKKAICQAVELTGDLTVEKFFKSSLHKEE